MASPDPPRTDDSSDEEAYVDYYALVKGVTDPYEHLDRLVEVLVSTHALDRFELLQRLLVPSPGALIKQLLAAEGNELTTRELYQLGSLCSMVATQRVARQAQEAREEAARTGEDLSAVMMRRELFEQGPRAAELTSFAQLTTG